MFKLHLSGVRQFCIATLIGAILLSSLTACGDSHKEEVVSVTDNFLKTAQSGDLAGAGTYTTDEVMTQLEWTDEAIEALKNNIYLSIDGYGEITAEDLKAVPEISAAVDGFIDKLKNAMVSSYAINEDAYASKDNVYQITATVATVSGDDINGLMNDDIAKKITAFATEYMTAHASELKFSNENEVYLGLYKELIPYLMDELGKELDGIAGSKEELWGMTLESKDDTGTLVITGIYDVTDNK